MNYYNKSKMLNQLKASNLKIKKKKVIIKLKSTINKYNPNFKNQVNKNVKY